MKNDDKLPTAAGQVLLFIQTGMLNEITNNQLPKSRKLASQCLKTAESRFRQQNMEKEMRQILQRNSE